MMDGDLNGDPNGDLYSEINGDLYNEINSDLDKWNIPFEIISVEISKYVNIDTICAIARTCKLLQHKWELRITKLPGKLRHLDDTQLTRLINLMYLGPQSEEYDRRECKTSNESHVS